MLPQILSINPNLHKETVPIDFYMIIVPNMINHVKPHTVLGTK